MGDIEIEVGGDIRPNAEFSGVVRSGYPGRYDGVVINTQILDSNGLVSFVSCNGRPARGVGRLFVPRESMPEGRIEFAGIIELEPGSELEVKFRASIIEQHKEIESAVVFKRLLAA